MDLAVGGSNPLTHPNLTNINAVRLRSVLGAALLLFVLPAHAANDYLLDDGDPNVPGARNKDAVVDLTETPSPILPQVAPTPENWITIDMRPTAFSFNPRFMNKEQPYPIIPRGFGVKIIVPDAPDIDSECNAAQAKKCDDACRKVQKISVACDVQFEWEPDATASRTLNCTGASPNDPRVAGSVANVITIRIAD